MFYVESNLGDWAEAETPPEARLAAETLLADNRGNERVHIFRSSSDPYPVASVERSAHGAGFVLRSDTARSFR